MWKINVGRSSNVGSMLTRRFVPYVCFFLAKTIYRIIINSRLVTVAIQQIVLL